MATKYKVTLYPYVCVLAWSAELCMVHVCDRVCFLFCLPVAPWPRAPLPRVVPHPPRVHDQRQAGASATCVHAGGASCSGALRPGVAGGGGPTRPDLCDRVTSAGSPLQPPNPRLSCELRPRSHSPPPLPQPAVCKHAGCLCVWAAHTHPRTAPPGAPKTLRYTQWRMRCWYCLSAVYTGCSTCGRYTMQHTQSGATRSQP
jgi:hypothetical protein